MDGFSRQPDVVRTPHNEEASPFDHAQRERARLCRRAASPATAPDELDYLSLHADDAVRASLFANEAFRERAAAHARTELARPEVTWVMQQAIAASPHVGEGAFWAMFGVRNGEHGQRSLTTLLSLVNNPAVPPALLATIVAERAHERFGDEAGDVSRPPHLHHAHLRRAYQEVSKIAESRLTPK